MTDSPAERALMLAIQKQWGPLLDSAEKSSGIPAAFFAALIANETGGKADAMRFEPAVFTALAEVLLGRKAAYGSIGAQDLSLWIIPEEIPAFGSAATQLRALFVENLHGLANLATSWGLFQIMGYEAIPFRSNVVSGLQQPVSSISITTLMLKDFARRNALDVKKDFSQLFDCWNTGRPHAPTADPTYIPDGLSRMAIYQTLSAPSTT